MICFDGVMMRTAGGSLAGTSVQELLTIIDRFVGAEILVVGDILVDHYIWGTVKRVSPEAPVVVVNVTREDRRLGGAGNVARNISSLGGVPTVCGTVGDDEAGRSVHGLLAEIGASDRGIVIDFARPTIVKTRVIAHSQQVVRIDREVVRPLDRYVAEKVCEGVVAGLEFAKGVIVSDYGKGTIGEKVLAPLKEKGAQLPVVVDPKSPNFGLYKGATVVKPNRSEASQACGFPIADRSSAIQAGQLLLRDWDCEMVMITLGEEGMVLVGDPEKGEPPIEVDTVAQEVFDVSGAGDTVSAVFTLALAVGGTPRQAAVLANCAAGVVVGEVGTAAINAEQLKERLQELS